MNISQTFLGFLCLATLALTGCGVGGPGGGGPGPEAIKDPLQIQLSADKTTVSPGEKIHFTFKISNPNATPVNLFLGHSHSGICFVNGSVMQARLAEAKWDRREVLLTEWKTGFCGTCSYAQFVAIPARGSIQYSTQAAHKNNEKGLYWNFGINEQDYLILKLPVEGKYLLRAKHEVPKTPGQLFEPDSRWVPKEHSIEQGWAPDASAPFWEGTLTSNEITVEVKAAGNN